VGKGAETVEVNADVSNLDEILRSFPGTASIKNENGFFLVTLQNEVRSRDLNAFLVGKGVVANHLVIKKKSLEKMFLEILSESN
jgi:ABC-2 type transport system ATP-binding protein